MSISTRWKLVVAALSMLGGPLAQAQEERPKWYAELGYTRYHFAALDDYDPLARLAFSSGAVTGTLGYQLLPHLAFEGTVGRGVGVVPVTYESAGTVVDANVFRGTVRNVYGLFFKPSVPLGEHMDLFLRLGWVRAEHRFASNTLSFDLNGESVAYGIGVAVKMSPTSYFNVSWMNTFKKGDFLLTSAPARLIWPKTYGFHLSYGMRF